MRVGRRRPFAPWLLKIDGGEPFGGNGRLFFPFISVTFIRCIGVICHCLLLYPSPKIRPVFRHRFARLAPKGLGFGNSGYANPSGH